MDLVKAVPRMSQEDFESILNSNMQVCAALCTWDNHFPCAICGLISCAKDCIVHYKPLLICGLIGCAQDCMVHYPPLFKIVHH